MRRLKIAGLVLPIALVLAAAGLSGQSSRAANTAASASLPGARGSSGALEASAECDCPPFPSIGTSAKPVQGRAFWFAWDLRFSINDPLVRNDVLPGPLTQVPHRLGYPNLDDNGKIHASFSNRDMQYFGDWERGNLAMAHDFDPDGKLGIWGEPRPTMADEKDRIEFVEGAMPWQVLHNGQSAIVDAASAGRNGLPAGNATNQLELALLSNIARANKYGEVNGELRENSLRLSWFLAANLSRADYARIAEKDRAGPQRPAGQVRNGPIAMPPAPPSPPPRAPGGHAPSYLSGRAFQGAQIKATPLPALPGPTLAPPKIKTVQELLQERKARGYSTNGTQTTRADAVASIGFEARSELYGALENAFWAYNSTARPGTMAPKPGELFLDSFDMTNAALDVVEFAPAQSGNRFWDYLWTDPKSVPGDAKGQVVGLDYDITRYLLQLASMGTRFGGHAAKGSRADIIACRAFSILVKLAAQGAPGSDHYRYDISSYLTRSSFLGLGEPENATVPFARAARGALLVAGIANATEAQRLFDGLEAIASRAADPLNPAFDAELRAIDVTMHDLSAYAVGDGREAFSRQADSWAGASLKAVSQHVGERRDVLIADAWQGTSAEANPGVTLVRRPVTSLARTSAAPKACPFVGCSVALMAEPAKPLPPAIAVARIMVQAPDAPDKLAGSQFLGRDEPFNILVELPNKMAISANLSVAVTSDSGANMTVPLSMSGHVPEGVAYGTPHAITLTNSLLGRSLSTKNGDQLTFTIVGMAATPFRARAYDNEGLAAIGRLRDSLVTTRNALQLAVTAGGQTGAAPRRKLAVIGNALAILDQKNTVLSYSPKTNFVLNNSLKSRIGEGYVNFLQNDAGGWSMGCSPKDAFGEGGWTGSAGPDPRFPGVSYDNCWEALLVHNAVAAEERRLSEADYKHLVNITIGGYHAFIEAGCIVQQMAMKNIPCASQFWLFMTGTDINGNPVDTTHQVLNVAQSVLPVLLDGRGQGIKEQMEKLIFGDGMVKVPADPRVSANPAAAQSGARSASFGPITVTGGETAKEIEEEIVRDYSRRTPIPGSQMVIPANFKGGMTIYGVEKTPGTYLLQKANRTCGLTVVENIRRMAGRAARTEQEIIDDATMLSSRVKRPIYGEWGTYNWEVSTLLDDAGLSARYVPDLNPQEVIEQIEKKNGWVVMAIFAGVDPDTKQDQWHSVQILKIAKNALGTEQVTYGDPWNGNTWVVDLCDFWGAATHGGINARGTLAEDPNITAAAIAAARAARSAPVKLVSPGALINPPRPPIRIATPPPTNVAPLPLPPPPLPTRMPQRN